MRPWVAGDLCVPTAIGLWMVRNLCIPTVKRLWVVGNLCIHSYGAMIFREFVHSHSYGAASCREFVHSQWWSHDLQEFVHSHNDGTVSCREFVHSQWWDCEFQGICAFPQWWESCEPALPALLVSSSGLCCWAPESCWELNTALGSAESHTNTLCFVLLLSNTPTPKGNSNQCPWFLYPAALMPFGLVMPWKGAPGQTDGHCAGYSEQHNLTFGCLAHPGIGAASLLGSHSQLRTPGLCRSKEGPAAVGTIALLPPGASVSPLSSPLLQAHHSPAQLLQSITDPLWVLCPSFFCCSDETLDRTGSWRGSAPSCTAAGEEKPPVCNLNYW